MHGSTEMGVLKCMFVWMVLAIGATTAQFKILGLLDPSMGMDLIDSASPLVKIRSFEVNQTDISESLVHSINNNGQARGFSIEQLDNNADSTLENKTTSTPSDNSNIIKVRIMEDESTHRRTNVDEPSSAIIDNAIGINNGLEADKISQLKSAPLNKPRAFQPNIRKFSYIEERSFHQNGNNRNTFVDNSFDSANQRNDYAGYKTNKVVKYRNHYKSRCRCERIWNCPKIQITIHRCEQDYFMCCF